MTHTVHMTRDGFSTVCKQVAGLNCVGVEDWECVTCVDCMDWFHEPRAVDMHKVYAEELPPK